MLWRSATLLLLVVNQGKYNEKSENWGKAQESSCLRIKTDLIVRKAAAFSYAVYCCKDYKQKLSVYNLDKITRLFKSVHTQDKLKCTG